MQTWDAIRSRRDVREFSDRPIAPEHLDRICEAGRRAPSSQNRQPWDFVVVTDRAHLTELATVWRGAGHVATSAATVALVAPVPRTEWEREQGQYDLGQATMSMMLAAADLGIGSGHAAVGDQARAGELLGLPPGRFCAYLVAFGHPAGRSLAPIRRPDRRPFEDVVHPDHW